MQDSRNWPVRPPLSMLNSLDLWGTQIGADGLRQLASSSTIRNLRALDIQSNPIGDDGLGILAHAETFRHLESLTAGTFHQEGDTAIGPDGARALTTSRYLHELKALKLVGRSIEARCVRHIAESSNFRLLRNLNLHYTSPGGDGIQALAQSPLFSQLLSLNLSESNIGLAGIQAIASTPSATRLLSLNLGHNPVTDECVSHLV